MPGTISPVFVLEVQYWKSQILRWAKEYDLEPNLVATIIQMESCGNPVAQSPAGALGLFQVMPFYFDDSENPFDPEVNAQHGLAILKEDLQLAGGNVGMALISYNNGPRMMRRAWRTWPLETQHYYQWGTDLYNAASSTPADPTNPTADASQLGTSYVCQQAQAVLWPSGPSSHREQ